MLRVVFPFKTLKPTVLTERQILQLAAHVENIKIKPLAHNQMLLCIRVLNQSQVIIFCSTENTQGCFKLALPEWVSKVDTNTEVAVGLVDAVHTNPQLPRVTSTCCKCKDGKKLRGYNIKNSSSYHEIKIDHSIFFLFFFCNGI